MRGYILTYFFIFRPLVWGFFHPAPPGRSFDRLPFTVVACDNQWMSLECISGRINIQSALYGRHDDFRHCTSESVDGKCGRNVIPKVKELCNNKGNCLIRNMNSMFTTFCTGRKSYLKIVYDCPL
ncbi:protein eva-1 homolog C-like [Ostrea edulis]|uniref:protein eva-1 homolog C-like n=1 Tax=Ostrea edulis TaxID=37623 RepID=UPI0024AE8B9D|nr:protein eva-1 homolog C-like [Ostrea edulis]